MWCSVLQRGPACDSQRVLQSTCVAVSVCCSERVCCSQRVLQAVCTNEPTDACKGYCAVHCCNTLQLQHTAMHCNAMQRTAKHGDTLQHIAMQSIYTATSHDACHSATFATCCNALQHDARQKFCKKEE